VCVLENRFFVTSITKPIEKSLVSNPVAENKRNSKKKREISKPYQGV